MGVGGRDFGSMEFTRKIARSAGEKSRPKLVRWGGRSAVDVGRDGAANPIERALMLV